MKKILTILAVGMVFHWSADAQTRLLDRAGKVRFYSEAPMENIEATTSQALGALDVSTGKVAVSILMKGFRFEKALMQEHFNENYVESDKYPKATFTGAITEEIDFTQQGVKETWVEGEMTIHGVTKPVKTRLTLDITEDKITANTVFMARVADYDIEIPSLVVDNIAEEVEVTADFLFTR